MNTNYDKTSENIIKTILRMDKEMDNFQVQSKDDKETSLL